MPAPSNVPAPYKPFTPGTLPDNDQQFLLTELQRISDAMISQNWLIPQVATKVPTKLVDGMQRLARSPWRPVGGTVDVWVYWDAPSSTWKVL